MLPDAHSLEISEREQAILKTRYIKGEIELEDFETEIVKWMVWENLSPLKRREFEMNNQILGKDFPIYTFLPGQ
jgi:hypothetical protein